jgi:hypothetical protein
MRKRERERAGAYCILALGEHKVLSGPTDTRNLIEAALEDLKPE